MNKTRSRSYVITYNNPHEDKVTLESFMELIQASGASRAIAQLERGDNGTPHIQGFFEFENQRYAKSVKKLFFPGQPHIEAAKSAFDSWVYCSKEDTRIEGPREFGSVPLPKKSKGRDYKEYNLAVVSGGLAQMVEDGKVSIDRYLRIKQSVDAYNIDTRVVQSLDTELKSNNEWHVGPPQCGKSSSVRWRFPNAYRKEAKNKWWDGYTGQDNVIIDEIELDADYLGHYLKIWGDHYAFPAEVKGGTINIRPKHIIVTTNYRPDEIFKCPTLVAAIERRFHIIYWE